MCGVWKNSDPAQNRIEQGCPRWGEPIHLSVEEEAGDLGWDRG